VAGTLARVSPFLGVKMVRERKETELCPKEVDWYPGWCLRDMEQCAKCTFCRAHCKCGGKFKFSDRALELRAKSKQERLERLKAIAKTYDKIVCVEACICRCCQLCEDHCRCCSGCEGLDFCESALCECDSDPAHHLFCGEMVKPDYYDC